MCVLETGEQLFDFTELCNAASCRKLLVFFFTLTSLIKIKFHNRIKTVLCDLWRMGTAPRHDGTQTLRQTGKKSSILSRT